MHIPFCGWRSWQNNDFEKWPWNWRFFGDTERRFDCYLFVFGHLLTWEHSIWRLCFELDFQDLLVELQDQISGYE